MAELGFCKDFIGARLTTEERGRVLDFLLKYSENPKLPGLSLERIGPKGANLWSARITQDLRAILYREGEFTSVLYADHHDDAYSWANRRRAERHPVTGSLQVIESVESIEEVQRVIEQVTELEAAFFPSERYADDYLLSLGVPEDWLPTVRHIRDDDSLLQVVEHLPEEVGERLFDLAAGKTVTPPTPVPMTSSPSASPDTRRRFWVVEDARDLVPLLDKPIEAWMHFLHPSQEELVTRDFKGPAKVTGSAGTGKTVVGLHRAREMARRGKRVLLTSFVKTLCRNLQRNLEVICTPSELSRITVGTVHGQALALLRSTGVSVRTVGDQKVEDLLERHSESVRDEFSAAFLKSEWDKIIEGLEIRSWDEYRDASRKGRGTALSVRDRKRLWGVFEGVRRELDRQRSETFSGTCRRVREAIENGSLESPFDCVIVDEVQDLRPSELRFMTALPRSDANGLMLVGDAGQSIYHGGWSLRSLGIETRGRSRVLRINYRTTEQIRRAADQISGDSGGDLDEGREDRSRTRSLMSGPPPTVRGFASVEAEHEYILEQIQTLVKSGLRPREIAIFFRTSGSPYKKLQAKAESEGLPVFRLSKEEGPQDSNGINFGSMHRAKGLEFKAVFVAGCKDGTLPLGSRLARIPDELDRAEAIDQERHLLYVSLTRARDEATITWSGDPSPFLTPLLEASEGVSA